MYKTIKEIKKLQFPLYAIPSNNWDITDGILFVDGLFVDDLNKPGSSIGLRRLQSGRKDKLKLNNPLFLVSDIINSKSRTFVSSCGVPFEYHKTGFQKIKYHRIIKFDLRNTFTFVWMEDITIPLEIPRPPTDINNVIWARVLYYEGFPWMIYSFDLYKGRDTRIKV